VAGVRLLDQRHEPVAVLVDVGRSAASFLKHVFQRQTFVGLRLGFADVARGNSGRIRDRIRGQGIELFGRESPVGIDR
jgi:hypothetical protein